MRIFYIAVGTVLLLFLFLWLCTREAWCPTWDFTKTGTIGDTIGGITSPIIGVVGAILVYASFLSQNEANKLQSQQNSFTVLLSLFKDLKEDHDNLTFQSSKIQDGTLYHGRRAMSVFLQVIPRRLTSEKFLNNSFISEYTYLIASISIYLDNVNSSNIDLDNKTHLLRLLHLFYNAKLQDQNSALINILAGAPLYASFRDMIVEFDQKLEVDFQENFKNPPNKVS